MDYNSRNFGYSMKSIPYPSRQAYINKFISQTEKFIRRLRWKVFFAKNKDQDANKSKPETFGFPSVSSPPQDTDLKPFETDMRLLIRNLEFRKNIRRCEFQNKMKNDIKELRNNENLFVPADKTTNHYLLKPGTYDKMLRDEITKLYKTCDESITGYTNAEAKEICNTYGIADRVYKHSERAPFLTIKDHKHDFVNKRSCRLINPANTEIGKMSKKILDRIIPNIRKKLELTQWINSQEVIDWFMVADKKNKKFVKMDIDSFYPSISFELLKKAIKFAKEYT